MDWNWFFSSIAQSAAAIVGIFGAFIITKVLSNQAQFGEKTIRFRTLLADANKLVDQAQRLAFDWYIRHSKDREFEKAEKLLQKDDNLEPDELYGRLNFPPYLARDYAIQALQGLKNRRAHDAEVIRQRQEDAARQRAERQERLRQSGLSGIIGFDEDASTSFVQPNFSPPLMPSMRPDAALAKERDAIDALEVDIRHRMRMIADFLATTSSNPESSPAITWALAMVAALFLIGVVYPLSFLPTPNSWTPALELHGFWARVFSLRGFLLIAISTIFLAALTMFAEMNRRLRYPPEKVQELAAYTHIGTYSRYYAIAEENEQIARALVQTE